MITNTGKSILAKYLIGQAPAYASYIAIGCGAKPLAVGAAFGDYSNKLSLDFEMFRVPITSRGYVTEDGVSKIVLTAELPTEERYEISEVGIFSAGSNPSAGAYDSKSLYAFTTDENWEHHTTESAVALPIVYAPLDGDNNDNVINQTYKVFQTNADNRLFTNEERVIRYETARFFNNIVMMRGDSSTLTVGPNQNLVVGTGSSHIHLTGTNLDFNKNSPVDQIKLAFSVINKEPDSEIIPDEVRILVEFASTDVHGTGEFARFQVIAKKQDYDFENNRYIIATKQLQQLYKSSGFTWSSVDVTVIYACVIKDGSPSDDFYIGMDALRFENIGTTNSLYGLTGYTVLKNTNGATVVKAANTTNYLEFRFAMDVQ
jgi:hypothetical protein